MVKKYQRKTWAEAQASRFGKKLLEVRNDKGLSAQKLTDKASEISGLPITRNIVSNIELGRRETITVEEIQAFAQALEVPPSYLLEENPAETALKGTLAAFRAFSSAESDLKTAIRKYLETSVSLDVRLVWDEASNIEQRLGNGFNGGTYKAIKKMGARASGHEANIYHFVDEIYQELAEFYPILEERRAERQAENEPGDGEA